MKVKLYAIGFSAVIIGFLSTYKVQAQQLLSLVKTEAYNNYLYGGFYSGDQNLMITEQIYTYNDKNLLLDLSTWQTSKGERNLTNQSRYIYNDDGNTLSVITKQRDHTTKKMNIQGMTEYEYNAEGKIESMVYQYRDYASGELVYSYKYDYIYGAGENQEMKIYNWSVAENNWITEPPYDEMEYPEEAIVSEYEGGLGYEHPGNKYELVYNEDKTVSTGT
ncbi:MAG: hypothetical protein JKY18_12205, partial [Flavobacteriales bacterium]|nr:hypothetical protein [Flavobacteriales bacterium]